MTRSRTDRFSETLGVRTRGKLLARALIVLFVAAIAAQFLHAALASDAERPRAPDFALKATDGRNLRLSEYRSDVVALAFWASWCGKCRDGLPVLESLQKSLGPQGLAVLSVSFDEPAATRLSFPVMVDRDGEVGRLYEVADLPMVVLVDREGRVRATHAGGDATSAPALSREIGALLAE
jgi:thiol-disulfide isomerase/thioredoxin